MKKRKKYTTFLKNQFQKDNLNAIVLNLTVKQIIVSAFVMVRLVAMSVIAIVAEIRSQRKRLLKK